MKKIVLVLTFILSICVQASVEFSLENFTRNNESSHLAIQRSLISYTNQKKIDHNFDASMKAFAVFSTNNSEQYIGKSEEDSFYLNLKEFKLNYKYKLGTLNLGVQESYSHSMAVNGMSAPGIGGQVKVNGLELGSNLLVIPSSRRYIVGADKESKNARLWSNTLVFDAKKALNQNFKASLNYDYFSNLGADIAFQSSLRGNSIAGNELDAEFLYDYSIVSSKLELFMEYSNLYLTPYIEYGHNLGAYDFENKFYQLGIVTQSAKWKIDIAYENVDKNALVAVYTKEAMDATGINGLNLGIDYDFKNNLLAKFNLANYNNKDTNTDQVSTTLSIVLRN